MCFLLENSARSYLSWSFSMLSFLFLARIYISSSLLERIYSVPHLPFLPVRPIACRSALFEGSLSGRITISSPSLSKSFISVPLPTMLLDIRTAPLWPISNRISSSRSRVLLSKIRRFLLVPSRYLYISLLFLSELVTIRTGLFVSKTISLIRSNRSTDVSYSSKCSTLLFLKWSGIFLVSFSFFCQPYSTKSLLYTE